MEINNENKGSKILADLSSLNLNRLDHVSPDVVLCAVIVKFGLSLVCSIAGVAPSLRVLPLVVQHQVLGVTAEYPATIVFVGRRSLKNEAEHNTCYSYSMTCKQVEGYSAVKPSA